MGFNSMTREPTSSFDLTTVDFHVMFLRAPVTDFICTTHVPKPTVTTWVLVAKHARGVSITNLILRVSLFARTLTARNMPNRLGATSNIMFPVLAETCRLATNSVDVVVVDEVEEVVDDGTLVEVVDVDVEVDVVVGCAVPTIVIVTLAELDAPCSSTTMYVKVSVAFSPTRIWSNFALGAYQTVPSTRVTEPLVYVAETALTDRT